MPHYLIDQLRFTRREFLRVLEGFPNGDAGKRIPPMNCISWIVGHLAMHENILWVNLAQDIHVFDEWYPVVGYGSKPNTPDFQEVISVWKECASLADKFLDEISPERLPEYLFEEGEPINENIGTALLRNIHHYWFHIGEIYAIRQMLGHQDLPEFVGDMTGAGYLNEGEE